jgi:hypothetical protein
MRARGRGSEPGARFGTGGQRGGLALPVLVILPVLVVQNRSAHQSSRPASVGGLRGRPIPLLPLARAALPTRNPATTRKVNPDFARSLAT